MNKQANNEVVRSARWFRSSYSGPEGGNCVETAGLVGSIGVRDSKDTARGFLSVSPEAWSALTETVKR